MAKRVKLFTGTNGLNTKIDPARIKYSPKSGISDLAACGNVDIDDTGRIGRRKGFTKQIAANCHSLFCDGGPCLFVTGDALCILHPDYTYTALRNVQPGARMRCVQVDDIAYYCNGFQAGRVADGLSMSWVMADTQYGPDTKREFSDPPIGTDVAFFSSRIWVIEADTAWHSEPFGFNYFDLAKNFFKFDTELRMIRPVRDGIYFSSEVATYFYRGRGEPKEYIRTKVADYPAIQYSDVNFHGNLAFYQGGGMSIDTSSGELSAMWMSEKGICYGGYDGTFRNLTKDKIELPSAIKGSGLVFDGRYYGLLNP